MAQILKRIRLPGPGQNDFAEKLVEMLASYSLKLSDVINGGLVFGAENMNCYVHTVTDTGSADTEFNFSHTLKRIPSGYIVVSIDKAGIIYKGSTAWDTTKIYLKCNVANCEVKLIIF